MDIIVCGEKEFFYLSKRKNDFTGKKKEIIKHVIASFFINVVVCCAVRVFHVCVLFVCVSLSS